LKKNYIIYLLLFYRFGLLSQTQPVCSSVIYCVSLWGSQYQGSSYIYAYDPSQPISNSNPSSTGIMAHPSYVQGQAISIMPSINNNTFSPTFYGYENNNSRTFRFWNGSAWLNPSHSIGGAANSPLSGLGSCGSILYEVSVNPSTGIGAYVYKYNGTGPSTLIAILSTSLAVYDVVADCNCNYYLLDAGNPQHLTQYSPNGTALCTYSITNPIYPNPFNNGGNQNGGLAMIGNTIYVRTSTALANVANPSLLSGSNGGGGFYVGVINGPSITFTAINGFPPVSDFATCPVCNTNSISVSTTAGSISCASATAALNASVNTILSPVSYSWSGPGVVAGTATNAIGTASLAGNYTCVINAGGCLPAQPPTQTIVSVGVIINTIPPSPSVLAVGNICIRNGTAQLIASPNGTMYSSQWAGPGILSGGNSHTATIGATGVYTLTLTNNVNFCSATTTVNTFMAPNLTLSASSNTLCAQNINGSLNTITLSASGANSYTLLTGAHYSTAAANATFLPIDLVPPFINVNSLETPTLIGDDGTCTNSVSRNFTIIANPTISASPQNPTICEGSTIALNAGGAGVSGTYTWLPSNSLNNANVGNVIANPTVTTVYTINANNAFGCSANSKTLGITVKPLPVINVLSTNHNICINTTSANILTSGTGTLFSWLPTQGLSSSTIASPIAYPQVNTQYTLTAWLDGCQNKINIPVAVVPPPNLGIALSSNSLCAQALSGSPNTITLTSSGAGSYSIVTPQYIHNQNPAGPSSTLSLIPPYLNTGPATATLYGSNGVCTVSTSAVFTVVPNPTVSVSNPTPIICAGQSFTYTNSGANSYVWSSSTPGSTLYTTGNVAVANPSINSVFSVIGGSLGCNSAIQNVIITVNPLPIVYVSPNPTFICKGVPTELTALGNATTFTWQPSLWLSNNNSAVVKANPPQLQTYTVFATLNNCTNSAMATVSVLALPSPSIVSNQTTLCVNQDLVLEGFGALNYHWLAPNKLAYSGKKLSVAMSNLSFAGLYTLTAIDSNNCVGNTNIHIDIENLPSGYLKNSQTFFCAPYSDTYTFVPSLNTLPNMRSFSWSVNDVFVSSSASFSYTFLKAGTYFIKGDIKAGNGCANSVIMTVTAMPKPVADFSFSPDKPIENLDEVRFVANAKGVRDFTWTMGVLSDKSLEFSGSSVNKIFENAGTFPVVLVVSNEFNCYDTIIKPITVLPDLGVYVPNAFTPNGDNKNEVFMPIIRSAQSVYFVVFDRWGEKLFETTELNVGWDGTFRGAACKQDVYVWKLSVKGLTGHDDGLTAEKSYSGEVLLLR